MRKFFFTICCLLIMATPAIAIEHEFTVGPEISHITYEEPGIMKEEGWFYGVAGSYTLKTPIRQNIKLAVGPEIKLAYGRVDYSSPISGDLSGIDDWLFETRLLGGVEFPLAGKKDMIIKPYTGFGYRSLVDDSSGKQASTGAYGYERWIRYYYIPVGVVYKTNLNNGWGLKATAEYDFFIRGKVKSYLSSVPIPGFENIENTQKSGYGLSSSIAVSKKFSFGTLSAKPYIKYWRVKDSNIVYDSNGIGWMEPYNRSTEIGLGLLLNF